MTVQSQKSFGVGVQMQEQEKLNQIFPRGICVVTPLQPRELKVRDELPLQTALAGRARAGLVCVLWGAHLQCPPLPAAAPDLEGPAVSTAQEDWRAAAGEGGGRWARDPYACAHPSRRPWFSFGLKNPEADTFLGILGTYTLPRGFFPAPSFRTSYWRFSLKNGEFFTTRCVAGRGFSAPDHTHTTPLSRQDWGSWQRRVRGRAQS